MATVPKPVHDDLYEVSCLSHVSENLSHLAEAIMARYTCTKPFCDGPLYSVLTLEGEPHCVDAEESRKTGFRDGLFVSATS